MYQIIRNSVFCSMKKLILISLLLISVSINAQTSSQGEDEKTIEYRQKIGIDYSMPDFNTFKIDGIVIGTRLAKMLTLLINRYDDYVFNQRVSFIQCEQLENLSYAKVEKLKISKISKVGDVITIMFKTKMSPNSAKIKNAEMTFCFTKGVSESISINDLFSDLGRYIKD